MAKTQFDTVDQYIATFPAPVRLVLETVRQAILDAVPGAEEVISYQIPAVKFHGWVFYFSAYTNHYSLSCPPPFTVFDAFKTQLAPYDISKSAIKFPLAQPVPVALIAEMAKYRASQNVAAEAAKAKQPAQKSATKAAKKVAKKATKA
jgi:uncharacterized protein YdhG (YjbR/CyaY superfamily)